MLSMSEIKTGDRVGFIGTAADGSRVVEPVRINRWLASMGPRSSLPEGYVPVRFAGGGRLMVHVSNLTAL